MKQIEVWRGRHGDPVPLLGPLPGVRSDDTVAYEFRLRFLDRHLHAARDPHGQWTDFPPRRLRELAALPAPLGPVVTAPG